MEEKCNHCGEMCHVNELLYLDDVPYCETCARAMAEELDMLLAMNTYAKELKGGRN